MFNTSSSVRRVVLQAVIASGIPFVATASFAEPSVAIVGDNSTGVAFCGLLQAEGFACVTLPSAGPDQPLEPFDVVIVLSFWDDPTGLLAAYMQNGGGVITIGQGPRLLGLETNATVQAWIGANGISTGSLGLIAVDRHPVLGTFGVGSELTFQLVENCFGLLDTTGHPNAVPLARWNDGIGPIGVHYNAWEGGQSVYFSECFLPFGDDPISVPVWNNAIDVLARVNPIPTTSTWALIALTLLLASAGTVLVRRRVRVWVR